jgi:hypothetical protein
VVEKHVLIYLRGMVEYGPGYLGNCEVKFQGYINLDWESNATNRNNILGCFFILGLMMIYWFTRKKTYVALRPTEVEYMVVNTNSCESI